jgi:hypothetical protein
VWFAQVANKDVKMELRWGKKSKQGGNEAGQKIHEIAGVGYDGRMCNNMKC